MRVGIAGLGTIGTRVAQALREGIDGLELAAACTRNLEKGRKKLATLGAAIDLVPADELANRCDVIVDCVPKAAFRAVAEPALERGRILVTVSGAALLENSDLVDLARAQGGRIVLVSGALLGLDAVRAAAEGTIEEVRMVTRKPPASLAGAPYLSRHGISLSGLTEPLRVFEGSAQDGAAAFPANVNVAAALGLAGVGPDRTRLEIWADPAIKRNMHTIAVESDSARLTMTIENIPSEENPATGKITALSVIAALRGLTSPLRVGT